MKLHTILFTSILLLIISKVTIVESQEEECTIDPYDRTDCNWSDENNCEKNGCCWDPTWNGGPAWCFYPKGIIPSSTPPPSGCPNFSGDNSGNVVCSGGVQTVPPDSEEKRRWQTPPKGDSSYLPTYQDYNSLVGYSQVKYNSNRTSAIVTVITFQKKNTTLYYQFGQSSPTTNNQFYVDINYKNELGVVVTSSDGSTLVIDPVDFVWNLLPINQPSSYRNGQKGAVVELFGWPYKDIMEECEMLGKAGYLGVKVNPQAEHVMTDYWLQNGELNPWFFNYQPVSYKYNSRMGTREDLRNAVKHCRKYGIRFYADAVFNHMSGGGNDIINHCNGNVKWGPKSSSGGSPYFTHPFTYEDSPFTDQHPGNEFPSVPYGPLDFHCERSLGSWSDPFALNYGWLVGLTDLRTESEYVQQRIADYIIDMIGIGFAGFRVDAAKHMKPEDLAKIFNRIRIGLGGTFTDDFVSWLEVLIGGEAQLLCCEYNSYNYYQYFTDQLKLVGISDNDINKIKIWSSDYPKEHPICGRWIIPSERFVVQNDDHDQQNPGSSSRDMGNAGSVLVKEKDVSKHRSFEVQLFERTDGNWQIRNVLSSYTFMESGAQGPPDGFSDCKNYKGDPSAKCNTVPYSKAHDPNVCGYTVDGWVGGKYTRVHRDKAIIMAMRKWMGLNTNVPNSEIGLPSHC